jgi:hypothetical protein
MAIRLAFLLSFFTVQFLYSQEQQAILNNLTQEQGLPSNETYCVIRDSKNYIWISSDQGVARLNGTSIKLIEGLPDKVVFKIREDKKGRIWFFSHSHKLSYFLNERLYVFKFNKDLQKLLKSTLLLDAFINDSDQIVMNTAHLQNFIIDIRSGKVSKLDYSTITTKASWGVNVDCTNKSFCFAQAEPSGRMTFNSISLKVKDSSGDRAYNVKLQSEQKFQFYGSVLGGNGEVYFFASKILVKLLPDGTFKKIALEKEILTLRFNHRKRELYVGLREGGLIQFYGKNFDRRIPFDILKDKSVTGIAFDNEGGEWFSTLENGVYYNKAQYILKLINQKVLRLKSYNDSIIIYADRAGLYQYRDGVSTLLVKEGIKAVFDIESDINKNIIVTGEFESIRFNNNYKTTFQTSLGGSQRKIFFVTASSTLSRDSDSSYLFRHSTSLLRYLRKQNGKYEAQVLVRNNLPELGYVYIDSFKNIWYVGLYNLYLIRSKFQKFTVFSHAGISPGSIASIEQMPGGHYVLGMRTGGIAVIDKDTVVGVISEINGFVNTPIKHLLAVGNDLWIVTSSGVSVIKFKSYDPLSYSIRNFAENAGLNNQVIYQLVAHQDKILVSTSRGLYQINNSQAKVAEIQPRIPFYITSLEYYKGDTTYVPAITLPYNHNRLVVNFNAISYNSPGSLKYYYRLSDTDSNWYSISSNQLVLDKLVPGNYTIQLKAGIPIQGRFSAMRTLTLTIEKPWWKKNVSIILAITLLLALFYYFYSWRINNIRKKEREKSMMKERLMDLEQTALRSQMNPHFIFNCLSSIQQLVLSGNKDEANDYLVKFARLIRNTLELSSASYISLAKEKDYITDYVEMEQLRVPNPFNFEFVINPNIDITRTQIPNMMLQPIIENSIRHGIKGVRNRQGIIKVYITQEGGVLICEIIDNGSGRDTKNEREKIHAGRKSYGLEIVNKRLKGLSNDERHFINVIDLVDDDGKRLGTKVILQLPFKAIPE